MTGAHLWLYKKPSKFGQVQVHSLHLFIVTVNGDAGHNSSFSVESEYSLHDYASHSENNCSGDGDTEYSNDDLSSDGYQHHSHNHSYCKHSILTVITIITLTTQMSIITQMTTTATHMITITLMTIIMAQMTTVPTLMIILTIQMITIIT